MSLNPEQTARILEDCDGFESDDLSFCRKCGGFVDDHLWADNARYVDGLLQKIAELTRERDELRNAIQRKSIA